MKEEREFVLFALPFATGAALTVYFGQYLHTHPAPASSLLLMLITACILLLLHPGRRVLRGKAGLCLVIAAAMSTGMLCALTSEIVFIKDMVPEAFSDFGKAMGAAIDGIPFRNPETNAVIKALITGDRHDIPSEITEAFRASGASHILALSGFHLGIIYSMTLKVTSLIGNSRNAVIIRSICIILLCGTYTLATGACASITRAFLFILLAEAAKLNGRAHDTAILLMAALAIQICISPQSLRSVGFQLSYAAMAGIAFIFPYLKGIWPGDGYADRGNPIRWVWNSMAMSVSCQITTGPLAFLYFGTFPKHFLLTNLIAIPLTGIIIPAALLTMVLSILGTCPEIMLRATEMLVSALSEALSIIAMM